MSLRKKVTEDFGHEWKRFSYKNINEKKIYNSFKQYFHIFPLSKLRSAEGFDMGCGTGRWARIIAKKVKKLNCIDGSNQAIKVAKENLKDFKNIKLIKSYIRYNILKKDSQDFGYCLGVLHHTSNPLFGLKVCHKILKKNAPFLLYLYYNFDNRPIWYKILWNFSDILRVVVSPLPFQLKKKITDVIALFIYLPLAKISFLLNKIGLNVNNFPLSDYKNKSFYIMRNDSLDRFGTKIEKRFSKKQIKSMLLKVGFFNIKFSQGMPYWVVLSYKK